MSNITPPGWYPDGAGWERRWDGTAWTDERRQTTLFAPVDEATRARSAPAPRTVVPAAPMAAAQLVPPPLAPPPLAPPPLAPPPLAPPPMPPGPTGARRGRLGAWVALALVLVVLAAATGVLAALRPWEGDASAADASGPGERPAATQGDLDGDGHGDAVFYFSPDYDSTTKVTAASDGSVFTTSELAVEPGERPNDLYLDWDGDGANEILTWTFVKDAGQLTLSSADKEFPGDQTFRLAVSSLKEYGVRILVQPGDFDGDGAADLAVAGPQDRAVDVHVLLGDGAGGFAEPVRWASVPNATIDSTEIRSGDFDHDGDADLWTRLPAQAVTDEDYAGFYSGKQGYAMLSSTGREFEVGAVFENDLYADAYLVGDVTGDGTTSLVAVSASSYDEQVEVKVYDLADGQPREQAGFTGTSTIGQRSLEGAALSDVDGDGRADVVFVVKARGEAKFTGVQVMLSTGAMFDRATVWAETPPCPDESCRIEFPAP
ncbi:FG-GAP-like repeat-containing protein [Nocardioides sp. R1-1]|uniref:FG-GAP-like repeat-containing protein n=1 Tax=Nocardioides sp. R1-1 TaxID=3383502 RepID=UPI0038D147A4